MNSFDVFVIKGFTVIKQDINIVKNILSATGQTAGPIGLKFCMDTHWLKKFEIFFQNIFFKFKTKNFEKKDFQIFFFISPPPPTPGCSRVFSKMFTPFGSAVFPALADI